MGVDASSKSASQTFAPGVEGVDGHLAVGRTGDLDPAVEQAGRGRRHLPVTVADPLGLGEEVEHLARGQLAVAVVAGLEQLAAPGVEGAVQVGQELQRLWGEDLVVTLAARAGDLHAINHGTHPIVGASSAMRNSDSDMEPSEAL